MHNFNLIIIFVLFCLWLHPGPILFADPNSCSINWPIWDNNTPNPHTVFGEPIYRKHDPNHNIVHRYSAFTVYYDDEVLAPRWTAVKMIHYVTDKNNHIKRPNRFKTDKTLKQKGYKVTRHEDYNNPIGMKKWNRSQMVQFDDVRGYGFRASQDSFYTSNICPQLALHNQGGWQTLQKRSTQFVRYYKVVWIYTGPIYGEYKTPFAKGRKIPTPIAFYKLVVSPGDSNNIDVLAFIMPHEPIPRSVDLSSYLVSVRNIENRTGIDFLHELPDDIENIVETTVWEIWPDMSSNDANYTILAHSPESKSPSRPGEQTVKIGISLLNILMFVVGLASAAAAIISALAAKRSAKASDRIAEAATKRDLVCTDQIITESFTASRGIPQDITAYANFFNSGHETVALKFASCDVNPPKAFSVRVGNFKVFLAGQKIYEGPVAYMTSGCAATVELGISFDRNFGGTLDSCEGTFSFEVIPPLDSGNCSIEVQRKFSVITRVIS